MRQLKKKNPIYRKKVSTIAGDGLWGDLQNCSRHTFFAFVGHVIQVLDPQFLCETTDDHLPMLEGLSFHPSSHNRPLISNNDSLLQICNGIQVTEKSLWWL